MANNKFLFLMCGIPGSGKSTWIENNLKKDTVKVVSRDAIRFSLVKEDEEYFSKENEVFDTFIKEIVTGLKDENKELVIADATHLSTFSRTKIFKALGENLKGVKLGVVFFKPNTDLAIERNENRQGTRSYVPESAIRRMASQFEIPSYKEGFDLIIEVDMKTSVSRIHERESDI